MVLVLVCVNKEDDCGRHCCVVFRSTVKQEKEQGCLVQPVRCWRCLERQGGLPTEKLVKLSEVESRVSTLLESVQTAFGLELTYPAVHTASEFEVEGWAGETGFSREEVVGTVEIELPYQVVRQYGAKVGALSDDGRFLPDGAPQDFIGPGTASELLTWYRRVQEENKWPVQLGESYEKAVLTVGQQEGQ